MHVYVRTGFIVITHMCEAGYVGFILIDDVAILIQDPNRYPGPCNAHGATAFGEANIADSRRDSLLRLFPNERAGWRQCWVLLLILATMRQLGSAD